MPISRLHLRGHPVHPMLVVFPLAFLSSTLPVDLAFVVYGTAFWAWLGLVLNTAGAGIGMLAALAGVVDFFGIRGVRHRTSAWSHAVAGLVLLALAVASAFLRWPDPVGAVLPLGLALSVAQLVLVGVAGWLGGTLSFRFGIGVYGKADRPPPRRSRWT